MILDIIFLAFALIIQLLVYPLTLFSDAVLPTTLQTALENIRGIISTVNPLFPIETLFICLGIMVSVELALFTYKGVYWLIKKIPTIS